MSDPPLRLVLVSQGYPSRERPRARAFVRALVEQWQPDEVEAVVVAPRRRLERLHELPGGAPDGTARPILRPFYVPFSNKRIGRSFSTLRITQASFARAVRRSWRRLPFEPQLAYGHFLFPSGEAARRAAAAHGIPAVVALGESNLDYYDRHLGAGRTAAALRRFRGILAVSNENRDACIERFGIDDGRVFLCPNAADTRHFRPRDRAAMRRRLGLPLDRRIVAFSGYFSERKGPLRVLRAIRRLPDVDGVFLGEGPLRPEGDRVLFADRVTHAEVPQWLCAADAFVLPTRAEGSPNAIMEAMACGLPIVSSDIRAVRDAVDGAAAELVDPLDEAALARAIGRVLGDTALREAMARDSLERGAGRTLADRARRILAWLREMASG